jgi:hypothetical protein
MRALYLTFAIFTLFITVMCENKDDGGECDDGGSGYDLSLSLDHQNNNVFIEARDEDSDSDCIEFDFLITVAPLNGVSSPEEIAAALSNNTIYSQRIAIEEEGVKQHSVNLSNLDENDSSGQPMIYAILALKVPVGMTPAEYRSTTDYDEKNFKMRYFGVYKGGDVPDIGPCSNCQNGTCPNGSPISCGCHGGFCLCTLCIEEVIFS